MVSCSSKKSAIGNVQDRALAGVFEQDTDHIGSAERCAEREDDGYNREDLRDHGDRAQGTRTRGVITED